MFCKLTQISVSYEFMNFDQNKGDVKDPKHWTISTVWVWRTARWWTVCWTGSHYICGATMFTGRWLTTKPKPFFRSISRMRPYPLKNLSTSFSLAEGLKRPMKIRHPLMSTMSPVTMCQFEQKVANIAGFKDGRRTHDSQTSKCAILITS